MEKLLEELKVKIIKTLNFTDILPGDINEENQLVGGELDIDSIDILELVIMIEKEYSVLIDSKELGEKVFSNLRALARYIHENSPKIKH